MDRIVRGIEIEDQPAGRGLSGLNEKADEQPFHGLFVHTDFMVAVSSRLWRMLQPVERGLAREHRAIGAAGFELARDEAQYRIVAQGIVIVEVLVAKRNAVDALGYECFEPVLDILLAAGVAETGRSLPGEPDGAVRLPQQQRTRIRGDRPAIERGCDFAASQAFKFQLARVTLCWHRLRLLNQGKSLLQDHFL